MIRTLGSGGIELDNRIRTPLCGQIVMGRRWMYLPEDNTLGLSDNNLIQWTEREDYTGSHLPHYLNYFMVHLVDGYLQTGGY